MKKSEESKKQTSKLPPSDIARYFLLRAINDGDLITPLKMQKLLYFAYAWTLAKVGVKLFDDKFEAWPNGPVVPSLYKELKKYRYAPIEWEYLGFDPLKQPDYFKNKFTPKVLDILDKVYRRYGIKSAFELVTLVHNDPAWKEARKGLSSTDPSNKVLIDHSIKNFYGEKEL